MKKIISLILIVSMFTTLIPLGVFAREYVVYETFDGYNLGKVSALTNECTINGQDGSSFEIKGDPLEETNKVLYIKNDATESTSNSDHTANLSLVINRKGKITVEFRVYLDETTKIHIGVKTTQLTLRLGKLYHWKKGEESGTATGFKYEYENWNTVRLVVDTESEVYDCYLNGDIVFSQTPLRGNDGDYKEDGITNCLIQSAVPKGSCGEAYIDDISVLSGDESEDFTPSDILEEGEEGLNLRWRPVDKFVTYENPPLFTWPAIPMAFDYKIQLSRNENMSDCDEFTTKKNYYLPSDTMAKGIWYWRVQGTNMNGTTGWSDVKRFRIAENARENLIPDASSMAESIIREHPRLWFNSETIDEDRAALLSEGEANTNYLKIKTAVDKNLSTITAPEPTTDTIAFNKLDEMYHTAFVYMIENDEKYSNKAIALLEAISEWDQEGFSSYKNHDQVHREVALKCSIVYDWLYNLLEDAQRKKVATMIKERVETMYVPLMLQYPLDEQPYDSHGTTASKMIFTICFALMHDIPEAAEWFSNIQPFYYKIKGWGGEDGGHANGTGYSNGTTAAADIARNNMVYTSTGFKSWGGGSDAGETPNKYYMYFMSNGAPVGSFGDDETIPPIRETVSLTRYIVDAVRYNSSTNKWASETRGASPYIQEPMLLKYFNNDVESIPPFDMINSYYDRDIGWIAMKSDIIDPWHTAVHFKSSFWGSYNHSHADNNSFILYAYGEPLAVSTGYYDTYYSDHDLNYSKQTLAHNAITYNGGKGQTMNSSNGKDNINAKGKITGYLHGNKFNLASGNAERAYSDLDKADRYLIYLKPDYVVVIDEISANDDIPTQFEFNLKGYSPYTVDFDKQTAVMTQGRAKLFATFQYPKVTDIEEFDSFIGTDGEEHRPYTSKNNHKRDHYGVRFDTDKVSETVMVTTLDVLKADEENKNVTVSKNDECMEIIVDGNKKVYVRLDYNKEQVSSGDITFKGTAAVFEDDSFMLVNGTELIKDGLTLVSADVPVDISYETGEIHIYGNEDGNAKVNLPIKINEIKNENGFKIASYNSNEYDYSTMPYKWTQSTDNIINIDYEAGIHNMYLNGTPVMKYDGLTVRINGRVAEYENPAFEENGTIYVPLIETAEMYNAKVISLNDTYKVIKSRESYGDYTLKTRKDRSMRVYPNSTYALYNNAEVTLNKPTVVKDGVFYIPLREYYEVFTDRIGWSDYAQTAWVYTEPVYCDDLSSTVSPRTEILTDEQYVKYLKEKTVMITNEDSGSVDVSFGDSYSVFNYTITPEEGCYIENIFYNGVPFKAFGSSETSIIQTDETSKKLEIIFKKYTPLVPAFMLSPLKFKSGDSTFLFIRLLSNGAEVNEYGIVISVENKEPDALNGEKVPFDSTLNQYGDFGYQIINKTGVENQPFYIRPYAKVGEDYIYGDVSYIEPSKI